MNPGNSRLIEVDWAAFDPWRIQAVRHRMMEHPLLQPDQLVELGKRLDAAGNVRTHGPGTSVDTPFKSAPALHPNRLSATETLQRIREANAWMALNDVQTDPVYRTLVDEVLDELRPDVEQRDPGMCYRAGWIFVTSPHAITPFHLDKVHNFILQVRGCKTLYVWDHRDTTAVSEHARDQFHHHNGHELVLWREELRQRAQVFHLVPGQGAYMPSTSPHMVENGDEPSITVSFTYYSDSTRRYSLLHKTHEQLRALGIELPDIGRHKVLDAVLYDGSRLVTDAHELIERLSGHATHPDNTPYAFANQY